MIPKLKLLEQLMASGVVAVVRAENADQAKKIADAGYYASFYEHGWMPKLGKRIRKELVPDIVITVSYIWHAALLEAQRGAKR